MQFSIAQLVLHLRGIVGSPNRRLGVSSLSLMPACHSFALLNNAEVELFVSLDAMNAFCPQARSPNYTAGPPYLELMPQFASGIDEATNESCDRLHCRMRGLWGL